jgi:Flp pilus assembly protein TadD
VRRVRAVVLLALGLAPALVAVAPDLAAAAICEPWLARVVSVQGIVEARRLGAAQWIRVALEDRYCAGDSIRVQELSRIALVLRNEAVLRLDQNTTITFASAPQEPTTWIEMLRGIAHFFSRVPRGLRVVTPFVNGTVEGTEFVFNVTPNEAVLTVLEGRVAADNPAGQLTVRSGEAVIARAGQPPTPFAVVRPRDAVQWALYYPSPLDYRAEDFPDVPGEDWPARVRQSIEAYRRGDITAAFASIEGVRPDLRDARFFTYRAVLLLSVGRVSEARADIAGALALDPRHGEALALQSMIAVVQNEKDEALRFGWAAVQASPRSAGAHTSLSYAQQASFDLDGALASAQEAVKLDPQSALARARLAELYLSFRRVDDAVRSATEAVRLAPGLGRTLTVLGFAQLAQLKTRAAQAAFERAVEADSTDALARLGLGLTRIRRGDVAGGRAEIEIAASLDPNNALVRSYLGKAYYEEKRDEAATETLATAKTLDEKDPTPWFYDAIRKQSVNRPVEALHDLQRAIELNDNRAIYQSQLRVDEDLAARSASLARIYDDLGFQKLALVEGWKSVNTDPANFSAHRFLADTYSVLPRHEIARVSELLQSQLLQPININPVQPRLAASNLFILNTIGPSDLSFNEFTPLFNRNRFAFQLSGLYGGNTTFGDEAVHSAVWGNFSYSLGQFHYQTDGFRPNNDLRQDIYSIFAQARLTHETSVQAEVRSQKTVSGDLQLRFDPENFARDRREMSRIRSGRVGLRHSFAPGSDVIASFIYRAGESDVKREDLDLTITTELDGYTAELQHLFRTDRFSLITGAGHFNAHQTDEVTFFLTDTIRTKLHHTNFYVYSLLSPVRVLTATVGVSADLFEGIRDRNQVNPKLGITWTPWPTTTVRAAAFRAFKRSLITNQTIEPTQVAGFNQFFDDINASDAWRYGVGVDHKVSADGYTGIEVSRRSWEIPFRQGLAVRRADWKEDLGRAYLYWTPAHWLALTAEYQYERLNRGDDPFDEGVTKVRTHRVPLAAAVFDPSGFRGRLQGTYIDQRGTFIDSVGELRPGDERFWIFDASLGYRLPKRWGMVAVEARNLLDKRFRFQDTDRVTPTVYPERLILGKFTLAY